MDPIAVIDKLTALGSSGGNSSGIMSILLVAIVCILCIQTVVDIAVKTKNGLKSLFNGGSKNEDSTAPKTNDIRTRLMIDDAVASVLNESITYENVNRAILFQFHNGVVMKSGMPFEYVVITHEATAPGVAASNLNGKHHDMRVFSELINKIIEGSICNSSTSEFSDPLSMIFKENGDMRICVKVITDILNPDSTLGFVMFSNTKTDTFPDDIDESVTQTADRISGILSNIWGRCEYCKNQKGCKQKKAMNGLERCSNMVPVEKDAIAQKNPK